MSDVWGAAGLVLVVVGMAMAAAWWLLARDARRERRSVRQIIARNQEIEGDPFRFGAVVWPILAEAGFEGLVIEWRWFGAEGEEVWGRAVGEKRCFEVATKEAGASLHFFRRHWRGEVGYFAVGIARVAALVLEQNVWRRVAEAQGALVRWKESAIAVGHDVKNLAHFVSLIAAWRTAMATRGYGGEGVVEELWQGLDAALPAALARARRVQRVLAAFAGGGEERSVEWRGREKLLGRIAKKVLREAASQNGLELLWDSEERGKRREENERGEESAEKGERVGKEKNQEREEKKERGEEEALLEVFEPILDNVARHAPPQLRRVRAAVRVFGGEGVEVLMRIPVRGRIGTGEIARWCEPMGGLRTGRGYGLGWYQARLAAERCGGSLRMVVGDEEVQVAFRVTTGDGEIAMNENGRDELAGGR
ncbi:MAG: hypothetical protein N2557_07140 [Hydrogenophilus sp.]|nr:hypothetical protein [Hydrogenophilus sp.]